MKKNTWFRAYSEALDDPKVQRLHPTLFKAWFNLLCLASQHDGKLPSNDDIAFRLRISAQDAAQYVDELILAGLVDIDRNGARTPHNWETRQFVSDTSTERVRKHRKHKKKIEGNVSEALPETPPEQSRAETEQKEEVVADAPPVPPKGPSKFECLEAFNAYNTTAEQCGLPQAAKFTPDRQRKISARLKDYGTDGWARALANIAKSSFLTGTNDRGWRADLEFLLQATSFAKVHDGGYGNGRHAKPSPMRQVYDQNAQKAEREFWLREDGILQ